ncbi:MAG: DNA-binding response regulator [Bacteroidetes bacterium]|jgi:two-component system, OmpR family, response regulator VicR|nr:MAG: DNA-binding response regulator [Bacteroidota bacterium]
MNTIMIVEDDILFLNTLQYIFGQYGYNTIIAKDGKEAAALIEQEVDIDLLITDLMLPFIGGLDLVNKLKTKTSKKIPVIVLSAITNETTVIDSFKLGVDDYLKKPIIPRELLIRVDRLLDKHNLLK